MKIRTPIHAPHALGDISRQDIAIRAISKQENVDHTGKRRDIAWGPIPEDIEFGYLLKVYLDLLDLPRIIARALKTPICVLMAHRHDHIVNHPHSEPAIS